MSTGLNIPIQGDSSGLTKAVAESVESFNKLVRKAEQLEAALRDQAVVSKLSADELIHLRAAADRATQDVDALRKKNDQHRASVDAVVDAQRKAVAATNNLAHSQSQARVVADNLDQRFGRLQIAVGGMSSALGASSGAIGNAIGGFADLAMSFAAGGPLMAGLAAVGAAVAYAVGEVQKAHEAAARAAEAAARDMADLQSKALDAADALAAVREGVSVAEIRAQRTEQGSRAAVGFAATELLAAGGTDERTAKSLGDPRMMTREDGRGANILSNLAATVGALPASDTQRKVQEKLDAYRAALARWVLISDTIAAERQATYEEERQRTLAAIKDLEEGVKTQNEKTSAKVTADQQAFNDHGGFRTLMDALDGLGDTAKGVGFGVAGLGLPIVDVAYSLDSLGIATEQQIMAGGDAALAAAELRSELRELGNAAGDVEFPAPIPVTEYSMEDLGVRPDGEAVPAPTSGEPLGAATAIAGGGGAGAVIGALAETIGTVIPGFEELAPLIGSLVDRMPSVNKLFDALQSSIGKVLEMLEPLLGPLLGIITTVIESIGYFAEKITDFLSPAFDGLAWVIQGITDWWNQFIGNVDMGEGFDLQSAGGKTSDAMIITQGSYEERERAKEEAIQAAKDQMHALLDNTSALRDVRESLTNIPSGYKIASSAFAVAEAQGAVAAGAEGGGGSGGTTVNIANWWSGKDASEDLKSLRFMQRGGVGSKGSKIWNGRRFADDEKG